MIYIIKFIYSFVLPPGIFVLSLLAASAWLWRKSRRPALLIAAVALLLYLSVIPLTSQPLIKGLERQYDQPNAVSGDVIVVLGGGATRGTPDLGGEGNLSGGAANRLLTAVRLHRTTGLPILFSGGQVFSDSGNEADIARRQLIELGVADSDILVENRSLNTEQNAVYTAALLRASGLTHPILVTSAFHMPRAVREFRLADVEAEPFPTDYLSSRGRFSFYPGLLAPGSSAAATTGTALKEYLGLLALKLR
ncbi:YdcF family protein [Cohnella ginsengisoli]|uniref:YdcF family protein n=1 Tax=Cohnella ginsengisoli TaxID=425004 RepID=A0A9X4KI94_9BACL|nr:YdcF family protein [Cohnella ginsengisoli]MDG0792506.1 YdcF family protein [Cohnella ginsengisoli]